LTSSTLAGKQALFPVGPRFRGMAGAGLDMGKVRETECSMAWHRYAMHHTTSATASHLSPPRMHAYDVFCNG
jgi:hypothetical protein